MSEEMVVRQCAPTLAGIKAGSLFPCPCTDRDALLDEVRQLNRRLSPKGLCLLPLRFTEGSALLYLYRPATLRRDLSDDLARRLLAEAGYDGGSCGRCVATLIRPLPVRVRTSPTRSASSSATLLRTSRASWTTVPAATSARGCGRCTATRPGPGGSSPGSSAARTHTASSGRPARRSISWLWRGNDRKEKRQ